MAYGMSQAVNIFYGKKGDNVWLGKHDLNYFLVAIKAIYLHLKLNMHF